MMLKQVRTHRNLVATFGAAAFEDHGGITLKQVSQMIATWAIAVIIDRLVTYGER